MREQYSVEYAQTDSSNYFSFQTLFDWISGDSNVPCCWQYPCVAYQALEPADFAKAEAENPPPQDCARLGAVE